MWTFDNFPIARANATLGTNIDQAWLDRVRLSSVRFAGCSAGIVSAEGLVMTNLISPGTGHVIDPVTHAEQLRRIAEQSETWLFREHTES